MKSQSTFLHEFLFADDTKSSHYQRPLLTDTEATVIDGLKQLTHTIFRPNYKSIIGESPRKSGSAATSPTKNPLGTNSSPSKNNPLAAMSPSENNFIFDAQHLEKAMFDAERFCAMVVQQITSLNDDGNSYKQQLDVYHSVQKTLFNTADGERSAAISPKKQVARNMDF